MGPVGIFDSGVGGLSVLGEIRELAPYHPVIYLADQAWAPYGERSLAEVRERAVAVTGFLVEQGCRLVVVACNSASAAALHHLRDTYPDVRFVGMEPAVKPAAHQTRSGIIGVLATNATFQGELYASVLDRHANGAAVVEQACPGLADAIERQGADHPETLRLVERYVTSLRGADVDTIVLGCTHYPLVLESIIRFAGPEITVIDPAPAVARQTLRLLGDPASDGGNRFLTTGDSTVFAEQVRSLLHLDIAVESIQIETRRQQPVNVSVVIGDLTRQSVDVIVNAANTHLQHGGGVAAAISRAGGSVVQRESNTWVADHGPLKSGTAAVTSAGAMPARHVVHVAGPIYREGQDNEGLLRAAVGAALDAAHGIGARTVAFPAISAGIYGYPVPAATAVLADQVVNWLRKHPGAIGEVRLVAFERQVADLFEQGVAAALS